MSQRSLEETKKLATWALGKGALYVKVGDFEMQVAPSEPVMPSLVKESTEEPLDPAEEARRNKEQIFDLMTHSG